MSCRLHVPGRHDGASSYLLAVQSVKAETLTLPTDARPTHLKTVDNSNGKGLEPLWSGPKRIGTRVVQIESKKMKSRLREDCRLEWLVQK